MHVCVGTCTDQKWVTTLGQLQGIFNWQLIVVCICERASERVWVIVYVRQKTDVRDKRLPVLMVTLSLFTAFTSLSPPFSFLCFPSCCRPISVSSQAGFGYTMASWDWEAAIMIGGLFIYNHKGEVLISRVYRDDIGYVSREQVAVMFLNFCGCHVGDSDPVGANGWFWRDERGLCSSSSMSIFLSPLKCVWGTKLNQGCQILGKEHKCIVRTGRAIKCVQNQKHASICEDSLSPNEIMSSSTIFHVSA